MSAEHFEEFVFSQSALQDYAECHRRFELRYVLDVRWPAQETAQALQYESGQRHGQEFHHLAHQHALGIPAEALAATINDDELRTWWTRYVSWQAEHLPIERYPELTLTSPVGELMLMAKYDVIAKLSDGTFLIVDWKTGRPQKRARLAEKMQTIVYPFVLAKAGDWLNDGQPISPDRIRFVYWFAETGETIEFKFSDEELNKNEARLTSLLNEITTSFNFEKTADERRCHFCAYRSLCERGEIPGDLNELEDDEMLGGISLDLDEIEEISF
ncbi:MAG: PD-(D/E)XK nuclease family protein [Acidobacteriota bacterium]|nr:PD-(D/E)XK nuclease family protein [Acidobacteriota bacterium]